MKQSTCTPAAGLSLAAAFNRDCRCQIVDEPLLAQGLRAAFSPPGSGVSIRDSHPTLFSLTAVFLAREDIERLRATVAAIEQVVAAPAYRERALGWADSIAQFDPGTYGACMGYDFHLDGSGVQLIEINTNAGGALLNAVLARAARSCCEETTQMAVGCDQPGLLEDELVEMFRAEWSAQRGNQPLQSLAIVDDSPHTQYLAPEFHLFRDLFERNGIAAIVAEANALQLRGNRLYAGDTVIDLVYNRLTDFALAEPEHAALREAYVTGAAVVTPGPRHYALFADKRNLTLLSDRTFLESLRLSADTIATLTMSIPRTVLVTPEQAPEFWSQRRDWFFKPVTGFGSRAAYRGDKLTRRVFEGIAQGGYVAQSRVDPARRAHPQIGTEPLKFDVRCYVYRGEVQLFAARLYQGQTTNFRTPGGGFAPVFYARS